MEKVDSSVQDKEKCVRILCKRKYQMKYQKPSCFNLVFLPAESQGLKWLSCSSSSAYATIFLSESVFVSVSVSLCLSVCLSIYLYVYMLLFFFSCCDVSNSLGHRGLQGTYQAPLSMGFPMQESWNGMPFPFSGHLPNQEATYIYVCMYVQTHVCIYIYTYIYIYI